MAVFSRSDKQPIESNNSITVIADGSQIEGTFNMQCKFHVDGEVKGKVISSNIITIGKKGIIRGEVTGQKFIVSGRFEGNVDCESVEILAGGSIRGRVLSKEFVIEPEGNFEGESRVKKDTVDVDEIEQNFEKQEEVAPQESKMISSENTSTDPMDAIDAMIAEK